LILKAQQKTTNRRQILLLAAGALGGMLLLGGISFGIWLATRPSETNQNANPSTPPPVAPTGVVIKGGGSTFAQPAVEVWSERYSSSTGVKVDYDAVGSSRGVRQMTEQVIEFGCTDAPLTVDQFRSAQGIAGEVVQIPIVLGAVVPTYNLPGVPTQLRFTGSVLADIYLGKITRWNDPAIKSSNPNVADNLPDLPITVVCRSDGSGTTFIWTDYLSKVSSEWKQKIGAKSEPQWPVLLAAPDGKSRAVLGKGNDGVAQVVSRTNGSIGYVELSYAVQYNLAVGSVRNSAGKYVEPSHKGVTAAASEAVVKPDLSFSLTDMLGDESYPISGATWAVFYRNQPAAKRAELVRFLRWVVHDGQAILPELKYAALPNELAKKIDPVLDRVAAGK